jgi:hypothetical protein
MTLEEFYAICDSIVAVKSSRAGQAWGRNRPQA